MSGHDRPVGIAEAFVSAGLTVDGEQPPEAWVSARCPRCRGRTSLDACATAVSGSQTDYLCPSCDAVVLSVSPAPGFAGYTFGRWVVSPNAGMWVTVPGAAA